MFKPQHLMTMAVIFGGHHKIIKF